MSLNATLFGQVITFAIFVWFTMKFVWPMLEAALAERQQKIADGLAAAQQGHKTLEEAQQNVKRQLLEARDKASDILAHAHKQAAQIIGDAKKEALQEKDYIVTAGRSQVQQEAITARAKLHAEVVNIAVASAEKILQRHITDNDHRQLMDQVTEELS